MYKFLSKNIFWARRNLILKILTFSKNQKNQKIKPGNFGRGPRPKCWFFLVFWDFFVVIWKNIFSRFFFRSQKNIFFGVEKKSWVQIRCQKVWSLDCCYFYRNPSTPTVRTGVCNIRGMVFSEITWSLIKEINCYNYYYTTWSDPVSVNHSIS